MVESLLLSIVIIITLGIASQWTAWRFQLPAIVVMAVAGLLIGPVFGIINPKRCLEMFLVHSYHSLLRLYCLRVV